jgi:hypothetical protein
MKMIGPGGRHSCAKLMAKATADIRSLARAQTALAIRTLTGVCGSKAAPAAAGVSAASVDRGWG